MQVTWDKLEITHKAFVPRLFGFKYFCLHFAIAKQ